MVSPCTRIARFFQYGLFTTALTFVGVPLGEVEAAPGSGGGGGSQPPTCPIPSATTPTVDSDGDGLSNCYETRIYGTNPYVADTDGDGMTDRAEIEWIGSDPLVFDPDSDRDGFADVMEVHYGLPPFDADGDNDGITDYLDVAGACANYLTKDRWWYALDADIDNDNLTDGDEWFVYGTNCALFDTDQDGYGDGTEIGKDTDPLDTFSYPGA